MVQAVAPAGAAWVLDVIGTHVLVFGLLGLAMICVAVALFLARTGRDLVRARRD